MRKIIFLCVFAVLPAVVSAQGFGIGDSKAGLSIGVGTVAAYGATFDQHFSMDWGIGKIGPVTVSVGFSVNNSYGATIHSSVVGSYDYNYTSTTYWSDKMVSIIGGKKVSTSSQRRYNDACTAEVNASREDVNAMFTTSFYYSPIAKLDVYVKFGLGVGAMNYVISNLHNEQGLKKVDHDNTDPAGTRRVYSFDDYKHVKWNGYASKACVALTVTSGVTWWLTGNWGLEAQLGLVSSNLKTGKAGYVGQNSVLAVGAAYRF